MDRGRKISGGRYHKLRKKKLHEKRNTGRLTTIGERRLENLSSVVRSRRRSIPFDALVELGSEPVEAVDGSKLVRSMTGADAV